MKKIKLILVIGLVLLCICGCDKKDKDNSTNMDNNSQNSQTELTEYLLDFGSNIRKYDVKCDVIMDIVDFSFYENLFITNDGKVYQISFDKIFSNNENCKLVNSDQKFVKFIKAGILNNENVLYDFDSDKGILKPYTLYDNINMPNFLQIIKKDYNNVYVHGSTNEDTYYYFDNFSNSFYKYTFDDNFKNVKLNDNSFFTISGDESIEYLLDGNIKTNKYLYIYDSYVKNAEECSKYADIKCENEVGFYQDKEIKNIDKAKFIKVNTYHTGLSSYVIVDLNNNVYTNIFGG